MNKLNINTNLTELIKRTIINYFIEILIYVNKKYPKEFDKKRLEKYQRLVIHKINVYDILPLKRDKYIRKAKIIARNKKIKYINKKYNDNRKTVDIINKHRDINDKYRCHSRIYNNGLKEIKYINGRKTVIYGKQCNRKIYKGNDSDNSDYGKTNKYCYFHLKNNKNKKRNNYGNFFTEPSQYIKQKYKLWKHD